MRIGIVLLPDHETNNKVKMISSILCEKFPCFFKLDSVHIPHLTLFHIDIYDHDLEKLLHQVENIANLSRLITVVPQALRSGTIAKTFIGVYFKNGKDILDLRQEILDKISKYLLKLPKLLNPHITITRLKRDEDVANAISEITSLLDKKYTFPRLGICEIGENGTCTKVIKSMELLGS